MFAMHADFVSISNLRGLLLKDCIYLKAEPIRNTFIHNTEK